MVAEANTTTGKYIGKNLGRGEPHVLQTLTYFPPSIYAFCTCTHYIPERLSQHGNINYYFVSVQCLISVTKKAATTDLRELCYQCCTNYKALKVFRIYLAPWRVKICVQWLGTVILVELFYYIELQLEHAIVHDATILCLLSSTSNSV